MSQNIYFNGRRIISVLVVTFVLICTQSCKSDKKKDSESSGESLPENSIEIVTEAMEFQMPDTITSGWNTWRYSNKSTQTHFILIDDYPDGITLDSVKQKVLPVFGDGMKLLNEGKTEEGFAEFAKLPTWFSEVKWPGGVGLISPGHEAKTTLFLDPGHYLVECYVKMNTGVFHTNMGMIKELVVVGKKSKMEEPEADVAINISSESGIVFEPPVNAGLFTFSVFFMDQIAHENFMGHDVNLVKFKSDANERVLEAWMDWRDPEGLIEPAPKGFVFLGGVNDMPEGRRAYFTAHLEPGKYALISEVPNASGKNLLKTFEILE
ncbi:hypothetical protein U3A58_20295 [Algoriphagus sp. C2-6-M1]|uniref:hypothetical protein n=1 Tax=Algoriphagus persicinus TaxID=3108754 RepID=UPI002B3F85A6|nr:hypothetical protein [Algoriphagus sp. C2-6-M1]MEB2782740.1 hypothetical protein [Algoriphagus sp. C2-6-M1]